MKTFEEYADLYLARQNNKEKVIKSTYELNELLHKHGISERERSQFVGTCLLVLKKPFEFEHLNTESIIGGIKGVLKELLDSDLCKAEKIVLLNNKILEAQDIRNLKPEDFREILTKIKTDILPYINDRSTMGQDILNLFFTTFNKYVGKTDKNQAFTPDHIVHFMCKVVGVNRNSRVLDPCCGSGAFLVRAMTEAMDDCANQEERNRVKKEQIYGIEYDENAFGLSTTNMLIHGDGNSNVRQGSCFDKGEEIEKANINIVLMNPPYNAVRGCCLPEYVKTWGKNQKEDPSKGFHFVYYIAQKVKTGKLAVLLPMQCAIGSSKEKEIQKVKRKMLEEHTLDAVFSLPSDVFHPGASANACCMVFNLGTRHEKALIKETFFGYFKDDGFVKKKNMGRIEKTKNGTEEGVWADIESHWLELYRNRKTEKGLSVIKQVTAEDEWLAEAYMETDYSKLTEKDFEQTVRDFLAYQIKYTQDWEYMEDCIKNVSIEIPQTKNHRKSLSLKQNEWKEFEIGKLFELKSGKVNSTDVLCDGNDVFYCGAKKEENGIMFSCAYDKKYISKGNCIVFICDGQGAIGYNNYMDKDFIATVNLMMGYNEKLNKYNGLFLVTHLDLERPKFSFGRKRKTKLADTRIKLPAKLNSKNEYEPDWQYMEDYIKSLPYADLI